MESTIKWQTGEPKEVGEYLTTRRRLDGSTYMCANFWLTGRWIEANCDNSITTAWCKLSDIEPYKNKEEPK